MAKEETPPKNSNVGFAHQVGNYRVYLAGSLFTQHDLAANISLKEAVWRLSNQRFELVLPQSKELRQLERPDLAAYLRNADLRQVVLADVLLARFDGPEIDAGAAVEFMFAKMLGKPAVVLRSDSRHLKSGELDAPYNLMLKNWPRTVEVYIDSLIDYIQMMAEARQTIPNEAAGERMLSIELELGRKGTQTLAARTVEALDAVVQMESPYPAELRRAIYEAIRFAPGAGFGEILNEQELVDTIAVLRQKNTL